MSSSGFWAGSLGCRSRLRSSIRGVEEPSLLGLPEIWGNGLPERVRSKFAALGGASNPDPSCWPAAPQRPFSSGSGPDLWLWSRCSYVGVGSSSGGEVWRQSPSS